MAVDEVAAAAAHRAAAEGVEGISQAQHELGCMQVSIDRTSGDVDRRRDDQQMRRTRVVQNIKDSAAPLLARALVACARAPSRRYYRGDGDLPEDDAEAARWFVPHLRGRLLPRAHRARASARRPLTNDGALANYCCRIWLGGRGGADGGSTPRFRVWV